MKSSSQDKQPYPWYDSFWLTKYQRAKDVIQRVQPGKLPVFVTALSGLRTRADFRTKRISGLFDDATMATIRQTIATFQLTELEGHEIKKFGRFVVHDHPFFTELQKRTIDLVSEAAGEPVEASYNFVSLYKKVGVCAVHMDAPKAKWTLDLCIEQSAPWPIHLSQVVAWPEGLTLKEKMIGRVLSKNRRTMNLLHTTLSLEKPFYSRVVVSGTIEIPCSSTVRSISAVWFFSIWCQRECWKL